MVIDRGILVKFIIYGLSSLMCFFSLLIGSGNVVAKNVGYSSVLLFSLSMALFPMAVICNRASVKYDKSFICLLLYFILVIAGSGRNGIDGLIFSFDIFVYILIYMALINMPDQYLFRLATRNLLKAFIVVCLFFYIISDDFTRYSFFFSNPNVLGLFAFISSFFL